MNLRRKLLFGIGIALIVTFSLVAAFSYVSMEQSYRMFERQEVQRSLDTAINSLNGDMENTNAVARDYAVWSETYNFVQGQNPDWIDQNMGDDFYRRFGINDLLIFNRSNQLIYGKAFNLTSDAATTVPVSLPDDTRILNSFENNIHASGVYGLLENSGGIFLVASHPILKDNFIGPAAGNLQVVKKIDSRYLAGLSARSGVVVNLIPANEIASNPSLAGGVAGITPDLPVAVVPESGDTVAGYTKITGLQDPEVFYLKVTEPRTIYRTGLGTIATFLISLFFAGMFIIVFVLLFIDRVVLSRLNAVISSVQKKTDGGGLPGQEGVDEIASLAQEIDPVFAELGKSRTRLKESEERYRTLVDQIPDYVVVHREGTLLYVNPAAAEHLGYQAESLIGKPFLEFIDPEYHGILARTMSQRMAGEKINPYEIKIAARDGTYHSVLVHGALILYDGAPASLNVLTDITPLKEAETIILAANRELENRVAERTTALSSANEQLTAEIGARTHAEQEVIRSLQEKDLLLREIHHRVKNNLQIVASLLNLQSRNIHDPNVLQSINDSQSRVRTMALVHERIYRSKNIGAISLKDYLNYLTRQVFQFYNVQQYQITVSVVMDDILTDIDTVTPLGLIVNELVSNSLKHAFPGGRKGKISIECSLPEEDLIRLVYHDDGVGIPAGFDWKHTESLGLRLVTSLVDQLNGTIESVAGDGTTFIIGLRQKRARPV